MVRLSHFVFREVFVMAGSSTSIMSIIRTPLGIVLSALTVASSISGELTAAAVGAAGLLVIVVLLVVVNALGK